MSRRQQSGHPSACFARFCRAVDMGALADLMRGGSGSGTGGGCADRQGKTARHALVTAQLRTARGSFRQTIEAAGAMVEP